VTLRTLLTLRNLTLLLLIVATAGLAIVGCAPAKQVVTLASTTSTEDSGLFSVLVPAFEKANPDFELRVIAVGTGEALELGRRKDADILLVHAPSAEIDFVEQGHGVNRKEVMRNDFAILGPADDAAGIVGAPTAINALDQIAEAEADYITRGDESGTHRKEMSLWAEAAFHPPFDGDWYISTGQGMGNSLTIASEKQAYILSDKATYLTRQDNLDLEILFESGRNLRTSTRSSRSWAPVRPLVPRLSRSGSPRLMDKRLSQSSAQTSSQSPCSTRSPSSHRE